MKKEILHAIQNFNVKNIDIRTTPYRFFSYSETEQRKHQLIFDMSQYDDKYFKIGEVEEFFYENFYGKYKKYGFHILDESINIITKLIKKG